MKKVLVPGISKVDDDYVLSNERLSLLTSLVLDLESIYTERLVI